MTTSGVLTFTLNGEIKEVLVQDVPSRDALLAFAVALQGYTRAAISRVAFTQSDEIEAEETLNAKISTTNIYLPCKMRDQDTRDMITQIIPAPRFDLFDLVEDRGYRLKPEEGEAITALYKTMSGLNLTYDAGWLCGSNG